MHMAGLLEAAVAMYDEANKLSWAEASAADAAKAARLLRTLIAAVNSFLRNARSRLFSTM